MGPVAPPGRDPGLVAHRPAQARAPGTPSPVGPGMPSRFRPALRDSPANAGVRQRLRPREPASADPCLPVRFSGLSGGGSPGPLTALASPAGPSRHSACRTPGVSARASGASPRRSRGLPRPPRPRSLSGPAPGPPRARCLAWRWRLLGGRSSLG